MQRRQFLRFLAGIGPGLALTGLYAQKKEYDVAIVGAGIAGLVAAYNLQKAGITDTIVLEAKSRVGGRTKNQKGPAGGIAEAGGQWVGPSQKRILKLMAELGIGHFKSFTEGNDITSETAGWGNLFGVKTIWDWIRLESKVNDAADLVDVADPSLSENASLDAIPLNVWLENNLGDSGGRALLESIVEMTLGATPDKISAFYFFYYVKSAGSLSALAEGAQQYRITGGAGRISLELAKRLTCPIEKNRAIQSVHYSNQNVTLKMAGGTVVAKRAIFAMSPADLKAVAFTPSLPPARKLLHSSWRMAAGKKIHIFYKDRFWKKQGLSGQINHADFPGWCIDNSQPTGPGVLLVFPNTALNKTDKSTRKSKLLKALRQMFGPAATKLIDYQEQDWSEEAFTSGCVSPLGPGIITQLGSSLRENVGPLHWAGTETATRWMGYMDGAVQSGEKAAQSVQESLK